MFLPSVMCSGIHRSSYKYWLKRANTIDPCYVDIMQPGQGQHTPSVMALRGRELSPAFSRLTEYSLVVTALVT